MKTEWQKELCPIKPEQFQQLSKDVWMQRKNIQKEPERIDGLGSGYECECRKISADVYEAIAEERDSLTMQAITEGNTTSDEALAEIMLNQMEITATMTAQDETLAEILLAQL